VPEGGRVGAGTGTASSKILGRERAVGSGVGYAAARGGAGITVAVLAVANPFGDVLGEDGSPVAVARDADGEPVRTAAAIAAMPEPPDWTRMAAGNTTLCCVMTDAALDKAGCARVARAASAGIARAVEPVFTDVDGDVVFCLAGGQGELSERFAVLQLEVAAASVVAAAIRDAVYG
jgi:L-aminopeptidase/D-esterase-like protein